MMGLNPFDNWWKPSSYVKWYYYLIGLILFGIVLGIAWVTIAIADFVSSIFRK